MARQHQRHLPFVSIRFHQNRILSQHQVPAGAVFLRLEGKRQPPQPGVKFAVARKNFGQAGDKTQTRIRAVGDVECIITHGRLKRLDARQRILQRADGDPFALHPGRGRLPDLRGF